MVIKIYSSGLKQRPAVEYLNKQHRYISDKCPLLWWKANENNYPNLGRHARCLLAIPVTCDQVFSIQLGTLSVANEPVCRQITQICLYLLSITRTFMTDFE